MPIISPSLFLSLDRERNKNEQNCRRRCQPRVVKGGGGEEEKKIIKKRDDNDVFVVVNVEISGRREGEEGE